MNLHILYIFALIFTKRAIPISKIRYLSSMSNFCTGIIVKLWHHFANIYVVALVHKKGVVLLLKY